MIIKSKIIERLVKKFLSLTLLSSNMKELYAIYEYKPKTTIIIPVSIIRYDCGVFYCRFFGKCTLTA